MPPRVASVAQRITNADVYSVYYVHRSKGPDAVRITQWIQLHLMV